jgi:hypothetical protein
MIESLLLAVTRVSTWSGSQSLTGATGFFFERDGRLFMVSNRHVVLDEASGHRPDRLEIELHTDADNVALTTQFSIPLYRDNLPLWRECGDRAGSIDVIALELERAALPTALPFAGRASGGDRVGVRDPLPGPGLFPHRRAHASRYQWCSGGGAVVGERKRAGRSALGAVGRARCADGSSKPGCHPG